MALKYEEVAYGSGTCLDITALVVSILGTLVTSGLESRRKIDDAIREQRAVGYRELWAKTKLLPRWPRRVVTRRQILQLSEQFVTGITKATECTCRQGRATGRRAANRVVARGRSA